MSAIDIRPDVREAIDADRPIVALESALITHGFAYPANVEITRRMAVAIREAGALPAVIGVWRGKPTIGLSEAQVATLAADEDGDASAVKVSVRDLPLAGMRGVHGGATVAATAALAQRVGVRVFATGGIGGVHRGHPEDISADLPVLANTPIVVVCAGAKAILDLPRTLEFLETWGVPVLGWQTAEFPAFYSRSSGLRVDAQVAGAAHVARIYREQRALNLSQASLVTAPIPAEDEIPAEEIAPLIEQAVAEAEAQGITGRAITPFILARMVELSDHRAQAANERLLVNNARIAAQIACELAAPPEA